MQVVRINGAERRVEADPSTPLLWILRDTLGLKGTKFGCGAAFCGACTVHIDGNPVRSCQVPLSAVEDKAVTTIEGIGDSPVGSKVQAAWLDLDVAQCGYCQAGQIMVATALLTRTPQPTDDQIVATMTGNICRCATYHRIKRAVRKAAGLPDPDPQGFAVGQGG